MAAAVTIGLGLTALPASADKAQDKSRAKAFSKAVSKTFKMQREAGALMKVKKFGSKRITTDTSVTCLNGVGDLALLVTAWDNARNDTDSVHNIVLPSNCTFQLAAATPLVALAAGDNVIITGGTNTVILGAADVRHFSVGAGARLSIYNLTLQAGDTPAAEDGGSILNAGTLTVYNCTLTSNTSVGFGGAIFTTGDANVYFSTFSSNTAATGGGAISAGEELAGATVQAGGEVHISTSTFTSNTATAGNGGGLSATDGLSTVVNSLFQGNFASNGNGGGTYNGVQSLMNAYGNLWTGGNTAVNGGGVASTDGFYGRSIGITSNNATTNGGGYFNNGDLNDAVLTLSGGYVTGNFAGGSGGGIYNLLNPTAQATVSGTDVSGNTPTNCINVTGCSP